MQRLVGQVNPIAARSIVDTSLRSVSPFGARGADYPYPRVDPADSLDALIIVLE